MNFKMKWRKITTMDTCKITATRSFRIISKALGIGASDLNGYHSFIETCPTISKYVFIMDSDTAKTGFLYSFLNDQNDNKSEDLNMENTSEDLTVETSHHTHSTDTVVTMNSDIKIEHKDVVKGTIPFAMHVKLAMLILNS
jgi:hypothetical protein